MSTSPRARRARGSSHPRVTGYRSAVRCHLERGDPRRRCVDGDAPRRLRARRLLTDEREAAIREGQIGPSRREYLGPEVDTPQVTSCRQYAASLALERSFWLYGIEHRGVVWDSRFDRTRAGPSGARSHGLYLLLAGWMSWHRGPLDVLRAPAAFVAHQEGLDGISGPRDFSRSRAPMLRARTPSRCCSSAAPRPGS